MGQYSVSGVRALLERCRCIDLLIRDDGDRLILSRDAGAPPARLMAELRAAKPAVLAYLRDARTAHVHPCACCGSYFFPEPAIRCYGCRKRSAEISRRRELLPSVEEVEREAGHDD